MFLEIIELLSIVCLSVLLFRTLKRLQLLEQFRKFVFSKVDFGDVNEDNINS